MRAIEEEFRPRPALPWARQMQHNFKMPDGSSSTKRWKVTKMESKQLVSAAEMVEQQLPAPASNYQESRAEQRVNTAKRQ